MWQAVREELLPLGLEVVTVALDTDAAAAYPYIDAAGARHPSLIDRAHLCAELFGIVHVPQALWIDETGMIVRPPETAFGARRWGEIPADLPFGEEVMRCMQRAREQTVGTAIRMGHGEAIRRISGKLEPEKYLAALRDWAERGGSSAYALSPDEVLTRSRPRDPATAEAAAHFELGQHLHRSGFPEDAVAHFQAAHHLFPQNLAYKRQAFALFEPLRSKELYGSDAASELERVGYENVYPPPDL